MKLDFIIGLLAGVFVVWPTIFAFVLALLIVSSPRVPAEELVTPDDDDSDDDAFFPGPYGLDGRPDRTTRHGDPEIVLEYVMRAAERRGRELLEAERKERA